MPGAVVSSANMWSMVQPVGTHAHFSLTFKRNAPLALAAFKLQTEVPVRCMWE